MFLFGRASMVDWLKHPYLTYYLLEAYQEGLRVLVLREEFMVGCEAWSLVHGFTV